jgi:hypothetical protein
MPICISLILQNCPATKEARSSGECQQDWQTPVPLSRLCIRSSPLCSLWVAFSKNNPALPWVNSAINVLPIRAPTPLAHFCWVLPVARRTPRRDLALEDAIREITSIAAMVSRRTAPLVGRQWLPGASGGGFALFWPPGWTVHRLRTSTRSALASVGCASGDEQRLKRCRQKPGFGIIRRCCGWRSEDVLLIQGAAKLPGFVGV